MPNLVSECCLRSVDDGTYRDFPLGGTTWGINYKTKVCSCCGKECDEVEACEECGLVGCQGECEDAQAC